MDRSVIVFVVFVFVMSLSFDCPAADDEMHLNGGLLIGSYHFDSDEDYNEENLGIALELQWDLGRVGVMSFKNSYYNQANAVYAGGDYYQSPHLDLGFNIAYVEGYTKEQLKLPIVPMLTAEIKVNDDWPTIVLSGIPGEVVGFGLGWRFW